MENYNLSSLFTWHNLPDGLDGQEIEDALHDYGQIKLIFQKKIGGKK